MYIKFKGKPMEANVKYGGASITVDVIFGHVE
jgi:hypothetical protein